MLGVFLGIGNESLIQRNYVAYRRLIMGWSIRRRRVCDVLVVCVFVLCLFSCAKTLQRLKAINECRSNGQDCVLMSSVRQDVASALMRLFLL